MISVVLSLDMLSLDVLTLIVLSPDTGLLLLDTCLLHLYVIP